MIWNQKAECMSRDDIEELQLKKLQKTVKRAFEKVPFYKEKYTKADVYPEDIESLEDIEKLPYTTKDELRKGYPFGIFAVDQSEIIEIHSSSGTTGKPVVSGYTRKDLDIWGEIMARGLTMMGADEDDLIQNTHGYGLFTGGFGVHYGAQKIGSTVIPMSTGQTIRQVEIMEDFGTNIIIVTPSYGLHVAEIAKEQGVDLEKIGLKAVGFGSEMWTEEMRKAIEKKFHAPAFNIYGLTEIMGPGIAVECIEQKGLHISEDYFYPEIRDTKTLKPLKNGEKGELVLTNLERDGMPIIRFRTKDITSLNYEECECGRTTVRMARITGRSDDMIKVKGVAIFPSQIEKALLSAGDVEPHYLIIVTRPHNLDEIEIKVEASEETFSDNIKEMLKIKSNIKNHIESEIGIKVKVTLVEPKSIPRSEGKTVRVIDKRGFYNQ